MECEWVQITKAKKMVSGSDASLCGNIIVEYLDNIIILESKVERYVVRDVYLNIPRSMLSAFDF